MSILDKRRKKTKSYGILGMSKTLPVACLRSVAKIPLAIVHPETLEEGEKVQGQNVTEINVTSKLKVKKAKPIKYYFCNPLIRPIYNDIRLINFPNRIQIVYNKRGVTTQHIKFTNITLKPVYLKLYNIDPPLDQITFINMSKSRCKRILPNLSFSLGFVYDDVEGKIPCDATLIAIASSEPTTTSYQICEIDLIVRQLQSKCSV